MLITATGYHNFHHQFPFDYKTGEAGMSYNNSKHFIDLMAALGLAYDLRTATPQAIAQARAKSALARTGA